MVRFSFTPSRGGGASSQEPASDQPVTQRPGTGRRNGCVAVALFGVFLLFGLGFSAVFAVPAWQVVRARSWTPVPCEILDSEVEDHPADDGDTYSVELRYRYEVGGRKYVGDRYTFLGGSSSGSESKQRIVDRLPPGTRTTCWVDPADPSEAVFERGFTRDYLWILLPLLFVAIGAGGIVLGLVALRKQGTRAQAAPSDWLPEAAGTRAAAGAVGAAAGTEPLVLEPAAGPVGKLFLVSFLALFWNGIVGVFVYHAWQGWREGAPDGCLTVFLVPFVLVGLALILSVPYQVLALFNPRPHLTLTPGRLTLGEPAELAWRFSGRPGRIRRLAITLEGREEAEHRSGKDTATARETFATLPVVEAASAAGIATGSARIEVPADTMHSFDADHNRIVWTLKVRGDVRSWPDVSEDMSVVVAPPAAGSAWSAPVGEGIWS